MNILLIGLGGFLGAISRYLLNELVIKYIPTNFPTGILIVNILGCLFVGLVLGNSMISKDQLYYFFAVGFWAHSQQCPHLVIRLSNYLILIF